jgi:hypothetical protein
MEEEHLEYIIAKCNNFEKNILIEDKDIKKSIYQIYFFDKEYQNQ